MATIEILLYFFDIKKLHPFSRHPMWTSPASIKRAYNRIPGDQQIVCLIHRILRLGYFATNLYRIEIL